MQAPNAFLPQAGRRGFAAREAACARARQTETPIDGLERPCGRRRGLLNPGVERVLVLVGLVVLAAAPTPASVHAPRRLDRTKLLLYRNHRGEVKPVVSIADWQQRRAEILRGMQAVMGPLPGPARRGPLDVKVEEEVDAGSYVRRLVTYTAEPGGRVPAYLLVPKSALTGATRAPGVLCLHQTHRLGPKVVVGLGQSPDDEYGVELVQRGFVCLAPAYPLLAGYQPDLKRLGYRSGTMKAIWDNLRGLDLLESLPYVNQGRFAAIGHSLGGHNAVFTAAFDERIKVVVSSCGLDSFLDYMDGDIKGWTSERYMPRLLDYRLEDIPFDFHEVIAALAPRRVLLSAPFGDTNFKWRSVLRIQEAALPVFALHGVPHRLRVEHPNTGHVFPKEMRELAYRMIAEELSAVRGR